MLFFYHYCIDDLLRTEQGQLMTNTQSREALEKYMPRNARYEPRGQLIYAETDKGTMRLCDLRGWGHLTGRGQAWGLDAETAAEVQDAIGNALAEAWNTRAALSSAETNMGDALKEGAVSQGQTVALQPSPASTQKLSEDEAVEVLERARRKAEWPWMIANGFDKHQTEEEYINRWREDCNLAREQYRALLPHLSPPSNVSTQKLSEDEGARIIGKSLAEMLDNGDEDYCRALGRHAYRALLPHLSPRDELKDTDCPSCASQIDARTIAGEVVPITCACCAPHLSPRDDTELLRKTTEALELFKNEMRRVKGRNVRVSEYAANTLLAALSGLRARLGV